MAAIAATKAKANFLLLLKEVEAKRESLWLTEGPSELSETARAALRSARVEGGIALSAMSLLEIARLEQKRRVKLRLDPSILPDRKRVRRYRPLH